MNEIDNSGAIKVYDFVTNMNLISSWFWYTLLSNSWSFRNPENEIKMASLLDFFSLTEIKIKKSANEKKT